MSQTVSELLQKAMNLPDEDRLELAEALLSTFESRGPMPFDAEWLAEAKRRATEIDAGASFRERRVLGLDAKETSGGRREI